MNEPTLDTVRAAVASTALPYHYGAEAVVRIEHADRGIHVPQRFHWPTKVVVMVLHLSGRLAALGQQPAHHLRFHLIR
jgi:hypothetical protein